MANYDAFITRNDKPKVLYFTDKKQTQAVIKALSKKFIDKLSFGEIRSTDELAAQFNVDRFPTLMVVDVNFAY